MHVAWLDGAFHLAGGLPMLSLRSVEIWVQWWEREGERWRDGYGDGDRRVKAKTRRRQRLWSNHPSEPPLSAHPVP